MTTIKQLFVSCPTCQKEILWEQKNQSKPFCSARCKLIDLGEWASEENKIPGDSIHAESDFDFNQLDNDVFLQ